MRDLRSRGSIVRILMLCWIPWADSRGPGEIDPKVDYTKVGSCYANPISWTAEFDPNTGDHGRVCSIEVESLGEYVKDVYGKCDYSDHYAPEPTVGQPGYHDAIQ